MPDQMSLMTTVRLRIHDPLQHCLLGTDMSERMSSSSTCLATCRSCFLTVIQDSLAVPGLTREVIRNQEPRDCRRLKLKGGSAAFPGGLCCAEGSAAAGRRPEGPTEARPNHIREW